MNKNIAASLNLGPRDLSATLILHTVLGKDHFIAISGEYRTPYSSFACYTEVLMVVVKFLRVLETS
jgi:phosphatidylinositol-bisphosphatase